MQKKKTYRCVKHGVIAEAEVEFALEPEKTEALKRADQDIRLIKATTVQARWHKGCGMPVEISPAIKLRK